STVAGLADAGCLRRVHSSRERARIVRSLVPPHGGARRSRRSRSRRLGAAGRGASAQESRQLRRTQRAIDLDLRRLLPRLAEAAALVPPLERSLSLGAGG